MWYTDLDYDYCGFVGAACGRPHDLGPGWVNTGGHRPPLRKKTGLFSRALGKLSIRYLSKEYTTPARRLQTYFIRRLKASQKFNGKGKKALDGGGQA